MHEIQDSKGNKGRKKQAGRKKRKNRKAIVTRGGRIPDDYGCIRWKKRAETGNAREKPNAGKQAGLTGKGKKKRAGKPALDIEINQYEIRYNAPQV